MRAYALVGKPALSGEVRRVKGVLPDSSAVASEARRRIAVRARELGLAGIVVPADNAAEAAVVESLDVLPIRTLRPVP